MHVSLSVYEAKQAFSDWNVSAGNGSDSVSAGTVLVRLYKYYLTLFLS